jgi:hypothetical protein
MCASKKVQLSSNEALSTPGVYVYVYVNVYACMYMKVGIRYEVH